MKNIKYSILLTTLGILSLLLFSCKTEVKEPVIVYNGFTEKEAINHIGTVLQIYDARPKTQKNGRWVQGEENLFRTTGVTVRFEQKLIKYEELSPEIQKYFTTLRTGTRPIHDFKFYEKFYINGIILDPAKRYVEFASYTDISNGKVVAYDMNLFTGNFLDPKDTEWYAQHVTFSPDLKEDIDRRVNIKTGERTEQYHYAYSKKRN